MAVLFTLARGLGTLLYSRYMRRFVLLVCSVFMAVAGCVRGQVAAPAPDCAAVCVMEPAGRRVLFAYHEHDARQVGGLQQVLTALCVSEAGELDKLVTIAPDDARVHPRRFGVHRGEQYSRRALMQIMLMVGGNDVARALARDCTGSEAAFVELMNLRAQELGMQHSRFVNATGLPAEQYSTAYDMALLGCCAWENETLRSMCATQVAEVQLPDGRMRIVRNSNKLLFSYHWVKGLKMGHTTPGGSCLIACGEKNGRAVVVVVLGSTNRKVWDEALKYLQWALGM